MNAPKIESLDGGPLRIGEPVIVTVDGEALRGVVGVVYLDPDTKGVRVLGFRPHEGVRGEEVQAQLTPN